METSGQPALLLDCHQGEKIMLSLNLLSTHACRLLSSHQALTAQLHFLNTPQHYCKAAVRSKPPLFQAEQAQFTTVKHVLWPPDHLGGSLLNLFQFIIVFTATAPKLDCSILGVV